MMCAVSSLTFLDGFWCFFRFSFKYLSELIFYDHPQVERNFPRVIKRPKPSCHSLLKE